MTQRKRNEEVFGTMARRYEFYAHKWRDRGYISCPTCRRSILVCPFCNGSLLLQKAETKPDFLLATSYVYVEAKGADDSWAFTTSIRPNQRIVAEEHETWLFLEIGTGRAPSGKMAFFVPWERWIEIEKELIENKHKSLIYAKTKQSRSPVANDVLGEWALVWHKGWTIPSVHEFWKRHGEVYMIERIGNGVTK
jgi:uncharacterized protein YbaR (Trm112 family)